MTQFRSLLLMCVGLYVCVACISVCMCVCEGALVLANRKHFTRSKAAYALRASTSSTTVQVSPLLAYGRNPITLLLRLSFFLPLDVHFCSCLRFLKSICPRCTLWFSGSFLKLKLKRRHGQRRCERGHLAHLLTSAQAAGGSGAEWGHRL